MNPHATEIKRGGVRSEVSLRAVRRVTGLEDTAQTLAVVMRCAAMRGISGDKRSDK